ncbi:MAG: 50S ribosomal protein L29 [Bradymonadaceae bacterium]
MKSAELKEKSEQELKDLALQLRQELFQSKLKHYTGQLQQTSTLRQTRRSIARIETILRERGA